MRKIDFIVIGAQKAGTSALDSYLRQHPEIGMPADKKELHFFDNETIFANTPVDYHGLETKFIRREDINVYGETTPYISTGNPA